MRRRTHLFVAPLPWGELLHGRRIAQELVERGDHVLYLAPQATAPFFRMRGVSFVPFRLWEDPLDGIVTRLVGEHRCSSVVIVDAGTFYPYLAFTRKSASFLSSLGVTPIALDVWDLRRHGTTFDHGRYRRRLPDAVLDVRARLLPAPFLRPTRQRGVYGALPPANVPSRARRARARKELGLAGPERLVLTLTSSWQLPEHQMLPPLVALARLLPRVVAPMLAKLDRGVRVMHVGPQRDPVFAGALRSRYEHRSAMPPRAFSELFAAADLLLTFNVTSTAIGTAIASGVPVLLGINSRERTAPSGGGSVAARIPPFYLYPTGLYRFMSRVLTKNPYVHAFRTFEFLDEPAFLESCHELLFDARVRHASGQQQALYRERVAGLPRAADWVEDYLR